MPFFRRLDEYFLALQTIFGARSRAVWQRVPQNKLYPAIPCTVEKALDHPRPGTSGRFGILLHRDLAL
jgi:hypothetical protein